MREGGVSDDQGSGEAETLSSNPIEMNDSIPREDTVAALEERLEELFSLFECQPTPDGWRTLVLELLAAQSGRSTSWIEVRTPYQRGNSAGARLKNYSDIVRRMKQIRDEPPGMTVKAAAELVFKKRKKEGFDKPSVKSLQRIWKEETDNPRGNIPEFYWDMEVRAAFEEAAKRLEAKSQK